MPLSSHYLPCALPSFENPNNKYQEYGNRCQGFKKDKISLVTGLYEKKYVVLVGSSEYFGYKIASLRNLKLSRLSTKAEFFSQR